MWFSLDWRYCSYNELLVTSVMGSLLLSWTDLGIQPLAVVTVELNLVCNLDELMV